MYRLWQETWILSSVDSQTLIQIPESPKDLLQKITCRNLPGLNFWDTGNWDFFFWLVIRINCGLNATTTRVTTVWLLLKDYSVSMVSDFLALVSLVFNLCKILKCSGCSQPHHFSRFLCFWFLQLQFYNGQWTGSGSMSCRRAEIAWPRCFGPRSPRCARLSRDRALCPVWTAWSFASNTSWRTKMPPTNSVITCPPRTANAALMPPRRATGKTGGWNICSDCDTGKRLMFEFCSPEWHSVQSMLAGMPWRCVHRWGNSCAAPPLRGFCLSSAGTAAPRPTPSMEAILSPPGLSVRAAGKGVGLKLSGSKAGVCVEQMRTVWARRRSRDPCCSTRHGEETRRARPTASTVTTRTL